MGDGIRMEHSPQPFDQQPNVWQELGYREQPILGAY